MRFNYYRSLSRRDKGIYDASDRIQRTPLPDVESLWPLLPRLKAALEADARPQVESICRELAAGILTRLGTPPVQVRVLAVRPADGYGELHGLYEGVEGRLRTARISLWMRTAKMKKPVAFKTFLRTLLHELGHHLDYEHFKLADSFHTEGFYKRESSLFYQLLPEAEAEKKARAKPKSKS
ncbi:MAG TPA: hypothetical protein VLV87_11490 [Gammaproteobacteria bacterium]|nr:hypothetical protein [Gammaproteobacteria bacterium]